jgi:hypothetical protein
MFFHVNPAAAVREHGQSCFVVNLDSEGAENVSGLRNDLLDELVGQESDYGSHGKVLSITILPGLAHQRGRGNIAMTFDLTYIPNPRQNCNYRESFLLACRCEAVLTAFMPPKAMITAIIS